MTTPTHDESKQLRTTTGEGKGQFAGNIPTPPPPGSELVRQNPPKTVASEALDVALKEQWAAERTVYAAGENAIREAVLNVFPNVHTAVFTPVNDFDLSFDKLLDADGNMFEPAEEDWAKYDTLSDTLEEIGDVFRDSELAFNSFGDGDVMHFAIQSAPARDVRHADADLDTLDAQIEALEARKAEVSVEGLILSIRERFEDAQTAHFKTISFGGTRPAGGSQRGSHGSGLELVAVTNKNGDSVWDYQDLTVNGEYEAAQEWRQSLNTYVRGIDPTKALTDVKHFGSNLDLGPGAI
jgi:hypothetical protein